MDYKIRTLCAKDLFPLSKIISCIGVKEFRTCFENDAIKNAALQGGDNPDYAAVGIGVFFDIAGIILGNLPKCENEIFNFLASITDLKRKDIEGMGMADFAQLIIDIIQKPEFKDFIGVVLKSLK